MESYLHSRNNFWEYYKTFESDIDKLSRYIELSEDNFKTYSVEQLNDLIFEQKRIITSG